MISCEHTDWSSFSYLGEDSRPAAEQGWRASPPSFPRRRRRCFVVGRPWWTLSLLSVYLMAASLRGHFCCLMEVVQSHLDTINRTECSLFEIRSNLFCFCCDTLRLWRRARKFKDGNSTFACAPCSGDGTLTPYVSLSLVRHRSHAGLQWESVEGASDILPIPLIHPSSNSTAKGL